MITDSIVTYMSHMGSDETVCDAARVSMDKTADMFSVTQNNRLINYLARHNHWSPFSHCFVQMRFKAPIFIARQLAKHQVGFAWNEVSRRYVSSTPKIWWPKKFRQKADNVKQGSLLEAHPNTEEFESEYINACNGLVDLYEKMVEAGVCPEQARAVLPQSTYTEWVWSGSLYAWSRMYRLRVDKHAQAEVQEYAYLVGEICQQKFPMSWDALTGDLQ